MKISATLFLASMASGASAFMAPAVRQNTMMSLRMSETTEDVTTAFTEEELPSEPVIPEGPMMSQSLPFMEAPAALADLSIPGNAQFDPLGFAKSEQDLMNYREAEIKHARLAMLAAAGWPISELFDKKLASWTGMAPLVDASDRAPSVLNGGLGKVSPVYWVACLLGAAAIDAYGLSRKQSEDYFPGNLGFDPFGVYPKDVEGQKWMQTAELKNGRLAMIAITAFAVQEFVTKLGVVDETPAFFKPIGTVLSEYTNSGYIVH